MAYLVSLDPGHGIGTPGKRSPDGRLREYEFNRAIAKRVEKILKARGIECVWTVTDNSDPGLTYRANSANVAGADIYVSFHANAFGNGADWTSPTGLMVFISSFGGERQKLAQKIIDAQNHLGIDSKRGVNAANFTVLTKTKMPAVLIEHGFMTNKKECEMLLDEKYRDKLALGDADGICDYLGVKYIHEEDQDKKDETINEKEEYEVADILEVMNERNPIYNNVTEIPDWGKPTVQKLIDKGLLVGEEDGLNISNEALRVFVINDRAGLYD